MWMPEETKHALGLGLGKAEAEDWVEAERAMGSAPGQSGEPADKLQQHFLS
jgi:hypothetical protein